MSDKKINVGFISHKLKDQFNTLESGKFEDKKLFDFIIRTINDLKNNPMCGTKIQKKLWPKEYKKNMKLIISGNIIYQMLEELFILLKLMKLPS